MKLPHRISPDRLPFNNNGCDSISAFVPERTKELKQNYQYHDSSSRMKKFIKENTRY
jgi:hypothetical protein